MMNDFKRASPDINLVRVNVISDRHVQTKSKNITLGMANVRSIKNKDVWMKQLIIENKIDICVLTETCLSKTECAWIESTDLNKDGYIMDNSFRSDGRRGGGISIVCSDISTVSGE